MFIVSLEYIKDLATVEIYLAEYVAYFEWYYRAGIFVMSDRKQPRTGGVILMKALGREQAEKLIAEDLFHRESVAKYTIAKFIPARVAEGLENYLETI